MRCADSTLRLFAAFLPVGEEEKRILANPFDPTPAHVINEFRKLFTHHSEIYLDELEEFYAVSL